MVTEAGDVDAGPAPNLQVDVELAHAGWRDAVAAAPAVAERAARAAFDAAAPEDLSRRPAEVGVRLDEDDQVRRLNREFRDRDGATNVLSFPALAEEELARLPADAPAMIGDIVVAFETTVAEAESEGRSPADHLSHLVVHGMLHLLGYDHTERIEAEEMERLETQVLARMGIADPYAAPAASPAETPVKT